MKRTNVFGFSFKPSIGKIENQDSFLDDDVDDDDDV